MERYSKNIINVSFYSLLLIFFGTLKEQKILFKMVQKRNLFDKPFSRYFISFKANFEPLLLLFEKIEKKVKKPSCS